MIPRLARFLVVSALLVSHARAEQTVCDLFKDLKAADGREMILTGELLVSKDISILGAVSCMYEYIADHEVWPTAVHLRPSSAVPSKQLQQLKNAGAQADRLRKAGKSVEASGSFSGHLHVGESGELPAEFIFDSFENLKVEALPDASGLTVVPICDLFQNLPSWKGQRIAVRGEHVHTSEGNWIVGRCKGSFVTDGYRWPVDLSLAGPAYATPATAGISRREEPESDPKGWDSFKGKFSVIETATYVGRLHLADRYPTRCRDDGTQFAFGFGHLNASAAELIVEEIRDTELSPPQGPREREEHRCEPPNFAARCAQAGTLERAASLRCHDRARELLAKGDIDLKDAAASKALAAAVWSGDEPMVKLLLGAGIPLSPANTNDLISQAASQGHIGILKMLIAEGADVNAPDHHGATYLATSGFFNTQVTRLLLESGANPNARDQRGATALMQASRYGYEAPIKLLIDFKADVNLKDNEGRSALMYAASGGYVDAIPLLLEAHADLHARDRAGQTALDLAEESENEVAVELLSRAMQGVRR